MTKHDERTKDELITEDLQYQTCLEQLEARFCNIMKEAFSGTGNHGEIMSMDQESSMKSNGTFSCLKYMRLQTTQSWSPSAVPMWRSRPWSSWCSQNLQNWLGSLFRMHSLPLKLQELQFADVECWDRLEYEEGVKSFLQPCLKFGYVSEISWSVPSFHTAMLSLLELAW